VCKPYTSAENRKNVGQLFQCKNPSSEEHTGKESAEKKKDTSQRNRYLVEPDEIAEKTAEKHGIFIEKNVTGTVCDACEPWDDGKPDQKPDHTACNDDATAKAHKPEKNLVPHFMFASFCNVVFVVCGNREKIFRIS
jgi:hypothetical protein